MQKQHDGRRRTLALPALFMLSWVVCVAAGPAPTPPPPKKMPSPEVLFSAAYLDSPVFNLQDGSLWVSDVQNDRIMRLLGVSTRTPTPAPTKKLLGKAARAEKDKEKEKEMKEEPQVIMNPPAPIREPSGRTRGMAFDQRGRLIMCESGGRQITRLENNGVLTVLADKIDNKRFNSPDDVVIDSLGRIYFTDPRFGNRDGMDMTAESVYRIDVDEWQNKHRVTRIIDNRYVKQPAGIALSPDETKLYLIEGHYTSSRLVVFELKRDGTIVDAPPYIIHDFGKGRLADGLCIDSLGNLFVAGGSKSNPANPPGIYAFSPEGVHLGFLPIPEEIVSSCRFGGWDMRTLFITASSKLYQARMPIPGFNVNYYPRVDEEKEVYVWDDAPPLTTTKPEPQACPVDERTSENQMLRARIMELEDEVNLQNHMIKERDLKLKEIEETISRIKGETKEPILVNKGGESSSQSAETASDSVLKRPAVPRRTPYARYVKPGEEQFQRPTPDKKADVRRLFNRRYDEL